MRGNFKASLEYVVLRFGGGGKIWNMNIVHLYHVRFAVLLVVGVCGWLSWALVVSLPEWVLFLRRCLVYAILERCQEAHPAHALLVLEIWLSSELLLGSLSGHFMAGIRGPSVLATLTLGIWCVCSRSE